MAVQYRDGAVLQEEAAEDHERDEHGGPHRQSNAQRGGSAGYHVTWTQWTNF